MSTKSIFYQGRRGLLQPTLFFAAFVVFLIASTASAQQTNPLASDPRAARAGGVIFRGQCATCHGADAKGISSIDAPDLTLMWTQPGMTEDRVFTRIQAGVPGSIMPPHNFPDTEIWMLVSYLRSVAVTGSTGEFTGDENSGARLFTAHCTECHRAGISGGSLGPNLQRITLRRSQAALRSSVRDPSSSIGRGYKPIILSTGSAPNVSGIIKGEDAFSIQILDSNQRLRGFAKSELLSQDRDIDSLMPAFPEGQLSDSQLDDILSYLHQQR
ncbi:MAG: putative heme-binding domain-containing protein [Kiritimatiellia bacterium]|jgi:putative heme-binding domain-containing protein